MNADSSDQDLKALWQGDAPQEDPMTLEHIQAIARRVDHRNRVALIIWPFCIALVAFASGQIWLMHPDALSHIGIIATDAGVLAAVLITGAALAMKRDPTEPGATFLRRQLERRLRFLGRTWFLAVGAMLPGIVMMMAAAARSLGMQRMIPSLVFLGVAIVIGLIQVRRRRRKLHEDLRDLDLAMKP
jgi:hypothetical protein